MPDVPRGRGEVIDKMIAETADKIVEMEVHERFARRKMVLDSNPRSQQELAVMTGGIKNHKEFLAFLEEIRKEV